MLRRAQSLNRVLLAAALMLLVPAPSARGLLITNFFEYATFDIGVDIPGLGALAPVKTEAITMRSNPGTVDTVWFAGTRKISGTHTGFVYQFDFDTVARTASNGKESDPLTDGVIFGQHSEGLAWAGGTSLLISRAPDNPDSDTGIYLFDLDTLFDGVAGNENPSFLDPSPFDNPEGLGLDVDTLALALQSVVAVDEFDDEAMRFMLDLNLPSLSPVAGSDFDTGDDPIDIEAPEGVSFFAPNDSDPLVKDLLLADDQQDPNHGRLVQVTRDGDFITELATEALIAPFLLKDPQGVEYDPRRRFIYLIGDDDNRITVLAPIPEPGAAVVFLAQALVVGAALRRRCVA